MQHNAHTDTDGILDKCHCGGFVRVRTNEGNKIMAECTECPEATDWLGSAVDVMVAWNRARRGYDRNKGRDVGIHCG
jgi:hypothetical protein